MHRNSINGSMNAPIVGGFIWPQEKEIKRMKISELIRELENAKAICGDVEVEIPANPEENSVSGVAWFKDKNQKEYEKVMVCDLPTLEGFIDCGEDA